jgi:hypothetical protein
MYTAQSRAARVPAQNMADRAQAGYYDKAGGRQESLAKKADVETNLLTDPNEAIESFAS